MNITRFFSLRRKNRAKRYMKPFSYKTIASEAQDQYKEKGSKFIVFAFPVENEHEVKGKLESLRKEYFDARHHCYAYRLGPDGQNFRANDDGEPNHSAGDPILGQLRSKELTNTLIVVVRYFGGIKLGMGGLIAAYRTAAEIVLGNVRIIEKEITDQISFTFDYSSIADVMRLVNDFSMTIAHQNFQDHCEITLKFWIKHETEIHERIKLMTAMGKIL